MNQIIISQSNIYLAGLILAILVSAFFTLAAAFIVSNEYRTIRSFNLSGIAVMIIMFTFTIYLLNWFVKQGLENVRFRNESDEVTTYYDLKKDRSLIIAQKKDSAPDWLAEQVKVRIIDENGSTYQVQFNDKFAEIDKKDVK